MSTTGDEKNGSVEKTRVRRALNRLGVYYGLHKSSFLQGVTDAPKSDVKPEAGIFSTNSIETAFLAKGETVPLVSSLFVDADLKDKKESNLLVTPYSSADLAYYGANAMKALANAGFQSPAYQGMGKPDESGSFLIAQMFKDETPAVIGKSSPIHVIQSFAPHVSPATRDADIASILLNGIPTIEWSRCVPYFEIMILNETAAATGDSKTKKTILRTFLADVDAGEEKEAQISPLHNALYDFESDPSGNPVKKGSDAVAASMDIFCMPQTMVNVTDYEKKIAQGYNPFAPLMTVSSFTTNSSGRQNTGKTTRPGSSPALDRSSTLQLRIHDKRRLNEVASLIKPGQAGGFGSTRLAITYGWGHPDILDVTRSSDANFSARYGDFLNASRVTEVYSISDSRLSFLDGGEVQVNMDLIVTEQRDSIVSQKLAGNEANTATEFQESVESLIDFMAMNPDSGNNSKGYGNFHVRSFRKKLEAEDTFSADAKEKLKEYFDAVKKSKVKKSKKGNTNSEGLKALGGLFAKTFGPKTQSVFSEAAVKSNPSSIVGPLITEVCRGHDPFLRPRFANHPRGNKGLDVKLFKNAKKSHKKTTKNSYVSFGKVVTYFLSKALTSSDVKETQIIFYPFNRNAAGAFDFNIAQFPISCSDLKKRVTAYVKENGNVQMNDFITFLVDTYIHDDTLQNSWVYGLQKQKKQIQRDTALNKIYGREGAKTGPRVEVPKIAIEMTTHKARQNLREAEAKTEDTSPSKIFRIEIYDMKCTASPFIGDVLGAGDVGAFQKMTRDTSKEREAMAKGLDGDAAEEVKKYAPDHQGLYNKQMNYFKDQGFLSSEPTGKEIKDIEEELNNGIKEANKKKSKKQKKDPELKGGEVAAMIGEFLFLDNSKKSMLQLLREDFKLHSNGYITIGCEGTSVTDVSVQTQEDSQAKSIELQRRTTESERAEQKKQKINSLPVVTMPTEIDITCLGNPFLHISQEYYVDLGTQSSLDGMYSVQSVEHSLEPGRYETKIKLIPQGGGTVYQNPMGRLQAFIAGKLKK